MPRSIADGSTAAPSRSVGVITYLAQDRHSSYGRDSLGMLKRSVRSLFKYYNARAKDDVLFFHTGLNVSVQQSVLPLCAGARARFLELEAHHFSTAPAAAQSTTRFCGSLRLTPKSPTLNTMTIDHARCSNEDAAATMPLRWHCAPRPGFAALAALSVLAVLAVLAALHVDHGSSMRPTLDCGVTEPPPFCTRQWRTDPLRLGAAPAPPRPPHARITVRLRSVAPPAHRPLLRSPHARGHWMSSVRRP